MDEQQPMGEFTRKFERDILGHEVPEAQDDTELKIKNALNEITKLYGLIEDRKEWLRQRFSNIEETEIKEETAAGLCCKFKKDDDHTKNGHLEFRCRDNDTHQAIFLECSMQTGDGPMQNDYVSFPVDRVNIERAKKFIQDKIFAFAKAYLSDEEAE